VGIGAADGRHPSLSKQLVPFSQGFRERASNGYPREIGQKESLGEVREVSLEFGHKIPYLQAGITFHLPIYPIDLRLPAERGGMLEGVSQEAEAPLGVDGIYDCLGIFGVLGYFLFDVKSQVVVGFWLALHIVNLLAHQQEKVPVPAIFAGH
jgi:hypothetical protein